MWIFLLFTLLAVALAAPIDFNANTDDSTGEKLVQYMPTESIIAFLRRNDVPELAIIDFFVHQLHLNDGRMSRDYFDRLKGWGRTWNISQLEHWQYDPVEQRIEYGRRATATTPETTTTIGKILSNDVNDDSEYTIRIIMKSVGVKDEAVDEFLVEKFHIAPFDMIKYSKLIDWGKKWNVENIDKMAELFYRGEKKRQRKEKELNSETNVVVEDPVEPTASARTADDSGVQFMFPKQVIEEIFRESSEIFAHTYEFAQLMRSAVVNGDILEEKLSIANTYLKDNLTEYEQQLIYGVLSDVEIKDAKEIGREETAKLVIYELCWIFSNTYGFSRILQTAIVDGEIIHGKIMRANEYFNLLPNNVQELLNKVQFDIQRKFDPNEDEKAENVNNTY